MFVLLKKTWVKVLLLCLFSWLIVTVYFYYQHKIIIWHYQVDQQIELEDTKIYINEIYVQNYRINERYAFNNLEKWIIPKLPNKMKGTFFSIRYFYSKPYSINDKYGVMSVEGQLISNSIISDLDNIEVEVEVVDDIGVHYASTSSWHLESESSIAEFKTAGDYYSFEKLGSTLKIFVRDNKDKNTVELAVNPIFTKQAYGFFNEKPRKLDW